MPHHHDHEHEHGHAHGHSHAPASFGRAFAIGASVNAAFVDRDTVALAVVGLGCGAIGVEALQRLAAPTPVGTRLVIVVAAMGIVVNGGTALLFMRGRKGDLNVRGAFMHMAADALVSFGVVLAGLLIQLTGWLWLDPAASLAIAAVITIGTWGLLRQSVDLAMDAVPEGLDCSAIQAALAALPGVMEVHDLHVWGLSTTSTALTAHLVAERPEPGLVGRACLLLRDRFGIEHATLQLETIEGAAVCALRPDHVI